MGLISQLAEKGFSATYFSDASWTTAVVARTDETVDFNWGAAAPDLVVPANKFSVRWQAYIAAPASGAYTLRVDVAEADELCKLYLDDVLILEKTSTDTSTCWEYETVLNAAQMHTLKLEYAETSQTASMRLQWMTTTTAPEVIPASAAYPAVVLDTFVAQVTVYHRAAKFIAGFALSETELNHLTTYKANFGGIDFKALTSEHWRRINAYTSLRNAVPQAQALLSDVFAAANITKPPPTLAKLKTLLYRATAWDEVSLGFLVDTHFGLKVADFKNEIALNQLREVMQIVAKSGLSARTIVTWGTAETAFNALNATAQLLKNAVKAKYQEKDWLDLAGNLSDTIRRNQQQALIAYLLTRPEIRKWGAKDADGLFEYFLIDVQMGACMDTSRIVQANAAIQLFINRCLLNLENKTSSGLEHQVSPDMIDKDRWEWMKNYRVWEANRKVFLYPENWLEPEWRKDRSEFFKELESYLVQNDITDRSVEQAFRNYLTSLNEVANLDVCGMHQENDDNGDLKYLHVFARTRNAPYKFFYRRWNQYRKWSAWERVPVDIRSVEDGDNSGVHLIPVVWKKRLFLFWPEFMKAQEERSQNNNKSVQEIGTKQTAASLEAKEHWEIRLAWSEYVDGKWSPKQLTKEFLKTVWKDSLCSYRWAIDASVVTAMNIAVLNMENFLVGWFKISSPEANIQVVEAGELKLKQKPPYTNHFMKVSRKSTLRIVNNDYLKKSVRHNLLYPDDYHFYDFVYNHKPFVDLPFFYHDRNGRRTYFVRPLDITIIEGLKNPRHYMVYLPDWLDDSRFGVPVEIPPLSLRRRHSGRRCGSGTFC